MTGGGKEVKEQPGGVGTVVSAPRREMGENRRGVQKGNFKGKKFFRSSPKDKGGGAENAAGCSKVKKNQRKFQAQVLTKREVVKRSPRHRRTPGFRG